MKRPLVPVALAYSAGILSGGVCDVPPLWWFAVGLVIVVAAFALPRFRAHLILPLLFLLGAANLAWRSRPLSRSDLRSLCGPDPTLVTIRGKPIRTPEQRSSTADNGELHSHSLAYLQVDALQLGKSPFTPACGLVLVRTSGTLPPHIRKHQGVTVSGVLSRPPGPVAPGLFNYAKYLEHQNVYFQLRATPADWTTDGPGVPEPYEDRFIDWARSALAHGLPEDESLRLIWSMALGWRAAVEREVYDPFIKTGTMHVFAISGLHVAFLSGILVGVFRLFRIPRGASGLLVLPLIWFYTAATGWQPSAIRAAIMMSIIIGGWALARPSDLVNSLCAAALIILVWDPQQLFGASFQLSFLVVLSIALFTPPLRAWRDRLLTFDPLLPAELIPTWKRRGAWLFRHFTDAAFVSVAACLGSLPLIALYFHVVSPVTIAANLLIVPMSSLALACNVGSLLCAGWLWSATEAFNNCAWFLMNGMIWFSDRVVEMPWGYWYFRGLTLPECVLYYVVLIGIGSGLILRAGIRRVAIPGTCVVIAAMVLWDNIPGPALVTVLPDDGALIVYTENSGGSALVDTGRADAMPKILGPFLRSRGVNTLDFLTLTHGDIKHVSGAVALAREFRPAHIGASPIRFRSSAYRRVIQELDGSQGHVQRLNPGDLFGPWKVLHPHSSDKFPMADDAALVLSANFQGTRILLLGDLGRAGQEALMSRYTDLQAEIVVTGLPANGEPLCDAILERIRPRLIIVGDSETPAQERVREPVLKRLRNHGARVISTARSGVTTVTFHRSRWEALAMSGTMERGSLGSE